MADIATIIKVLNRHNDLDLEHTNPTFSQNTPAYQYHLTYHQIVWLQKVQQFEEQIILQMIIFWLYVLSFSYYDLDLVKNKHLHDILVYDDVSQY